MKSHAVLALTVLMMMVAQAAHAGHPKPQPKPAPAPVITMPEQDKQHLLHDTFVVVKTVREIPEAVRKQIIPDGKDVLNGMADPGQNYQTTDVLGRKLMPFRRLIFTATSQECCLIYYEFGGYASGQRAELFRLSGGQATRAWSGNLTGARQPLTLSHLRAEISKGNYYTLRRD